MRLNFSFDIHFNNEVFNYTFAVSVVASSFNFIFCIA